MSLLSRFGGGLRALLQRKKADQELDDELQAYLDAAAEHHVASGMSADAARRTARLSLGSVEAVKDHTRDVGWESIVGALRQDVRYGLRTLANAPTLLLAAALVPEAGVVVRSASLDLTHLGVNQIHIDPTTLAFTLAVTVATAVLFGLAPAWRATRIDILGTMKTGGSGSIAHGPRVAGLRNLLIICETALALVLLVASGVMIQSVRNLQRTELGFVPDWLVTADLSLPTRRYDTGRMTRFFVDLHDRVRSLPGVESVAFSNTSPVSGDRNSTSVWFPDKPSVPAGSESLIGVHWTSPAYFSTMGIHVLKGRIFTDRDRTGTPQVVVINETAARSLFKGEDPIGRRIAMGFSRSGFGGNDGAEVIGIVNDVRYESVERAANSDAYVSLLQSPVDEGVLLIRTPLDPVPSLR